MDIFNHFKNLTLSEDQKIAIGDLQVFINGSTNVFILKGYAGSGKTTILKGLVDYLHTQNREFSVMAPTGRAAKILRDKTGKGQTIHSSIYDFNNLIAINSESEEDADHTFHFTFPVVNDQRFEHIIIVDEASMISSKESKNELFTFGTDILLQDLMTYARLSVSKNKIIFVGDPAQLPPVNDNNSWALEESFFHKLNLSCSSIEMKQVMRQADNLILKNATVIREVLKSETRNKLVFEYDQNTFCKVRSEEITSRYLEFYPTPEIGNGVIITFSNAQCLSYNRAIREKIFPENSDVVEGDILSINNNNYRTYGTEIFNGDMAMVVRVSDKTETQSAPVWVDEGGRKVKKTFNFIFRDVEIRLPDYPEIIPCKIIDSLLNSNERDLGVDELKALYINFVMRFKSEQTKRKEMGSDFYKVGSEQFKMQLINDPYFNAMRVKYGYAVTCHKAQGGEWDTTFVDYYGRVGLKNAQLRWCYTATTRAVNRCFVSNPPHFDFFTKLSFSRIIRTGSFPENALNLANVALSPFHMENQHRCKSLKYWEIAEKLKDTSFELQKVESLGEYQERYYFRQGNKEFIVDGIHNKAGFFKDFKSIQNREYSADLLSVINNPVPAILNIDYNPSNPEFESLFSRVQDYCEELSISITNIEERLDLYFVMYYFKTSGICSVIQFCFNRNFQFTTAMPKSDFGDDDVKLVSLIQKLSHHAI